MVELLWFNSLHCGILAFIRNALLTCHNGHQVKHVYVSTCQCEEVVCSVGQTITTITESFVFCLTTTQKTQ